MADGAITHLRLSLEEWLRLAPPMPEDHMDVVRQVVTSALRHELAEAQARAHNLTQQLERVNVLTTTLQPTVNVGTTSNVAVTEPVGPPLNQPTANRFSVSAIIRGFIDQNPGSRSSAIVAAVARYRPEVQAKVVHAELYRLSQQGDLVRHGTRPNTTYFLASADSPREDDPIEAAG